MIADEYRAIRERAAGLRSSPEVRASDRKAPTAAPLHVRRWYLRRARQQSERMRRAWLSNPRLV